MTGDGIGAAFVRLALRIDRHCPGYVDAYFGPEDLALAVRDEDPAPLADLASAAVELAEEIARDAALSQARREYLHAEVTAMRTTLRILQGDPPEFTEEVRLLYGVTPAWTDEREFTAAHEVLEAIVPGSGPLSRRVPEFRRRLRVSVDVATPAIVRLAADFRERVRARFSLPPHESCDFTVVRDQPWTAYNWYLGGSASRIEFNESHPIRIHQLPEIVAHEAYPGHHTEHATKEEELYHREGRIEFSVLPSNTPSALVSEGIAQNALEVIAEPDEIVALYAGLLKAAGLPESDARTVYEVTQATRTLDKVGDNQLLMLYRDDAPDDEVLAYGLRYELTSVDDQQRHMAFFKEPLWRSYGFNYTIGRDVVRAYLDAAGDRGEAFAHLLEEPMTPGQLLAASGAVE